MVVRRELMRGLERLNATTTVLQRARRADPLGGMWEAADVQWWWRRPRATDELALPVWFDEVGPVAAAGLTAWGDTWQADVFAVPSIVDEEEVWAATLEAAAGHRDGALEMLVHEDDAPLVSLAIESGFTMTDELSGTSWMDADQRPPVAQVDGFAIVDRVTRADRPHPMIARNGELVEPRLRQCSLYDPTLDLAVEDADGTAAGYALFWFDPTTQVGLLEPMRVEDEYQRRGLARMLLTHGLDRLARKGARRLKVGFETDPARNLYLGAGFVQTSVDRLLTRPATREPSGVTPTGHDGATGTTTGRGCCRAAGRPGCRRPRATAPGRSACAIRAGASPATPTTAIPRTAAEARSRPPRRSGAAAGGSRRRCCPAPRAHAPTRGSGSAASASGSKKIGSPCS